MGRMWVSLDEYESIGTHWIALFTNGDKVTYLESFKNRVKYIPKESKHIYKKKKIIANIYRIQEYDLIMCGYFCIRFIDFILKGKKL